MRLDPAWPEENGFERATYRVEVRKLGEAVSSPVAPARSVRTGDFTWACATPHPPLELWVVLRNARGIEHERREIVRPAADETREALIAFP